MRPSEGASVYRIVWRVPGLPAHESRPSRPPDAWHPCCGPANPANIDGAPEFVWSAFATVDVYSREVVYTDSCIQSHSSKRGSPVHLEDLYRLLRTEHVQAQGIVDTVADPMLVLDESLCVQAASRAYFDVFKADRYDTIGKRVYELGNGQWDIPELRVLLSEVIPKATAIIDYKVEGDFADLGRRTMLLSARTLVLPGNNSRLLLLAMADATERYQRESTQRMLYEEARHRMRNLLGLAQSLAGQTPTEGLTAAEYRDAFLGRFRALVEAQDLAISETELAALIERTLAPYRTGANSIAIDAAPITLNSRAVMPLSLALHELATNAVKYGALSVQGGRLQVSAQVDEAAGSLRLCWTERGGPRVTPPCATGYGTTLIQSVTTYTLGGKVDRQWKSEGLEAEFVLPLAVLR